MAMVDQDGNHTGAAAADETDQLYQALHSRLVTTGEWHKLSNTLEQLLQDSNWTTQVSENAAARAKSMEELNVDELVRGVLDDGKRSIPRNVESQMLKQIREFLDRNLEDA